MLTSRDRIRHLPAQRLIPQPYRNFKNINRRYVSIGVEGRPIRGSKNGTNGVKNAGSSNSASMRASSSGSRCNSSGRTDSHNDG
jgi:hypothetical protein